jgi:nitrite reductase (cytochrome c-552)
MSMARLAIVFGVVLVATVLVVALLVSIFERQQQARAQFFRVTEIPHQEPDLSVWGENFPSQYDAYVRTEETSDVVDYSRYGRYGGSEAFSRLDKYPAYVRLFAGYPFSVEYREDRGHLWAVEDVMETERLGQNKPGACFTCKSSNVPSMMAQIGPEQFYRTNMYELIDQFQPVHPISCADCHDAETMRLTITRPAFREAMEGRGIDLARATHQEMRTYVCAQCHVEYYFRGEGRYLTFPWQNGTRIEEMEAYYDEAGFSDWQHAETGAPMIKMQHPEFEMWSTGIHGRSGVSCADCHMPYMREGAVKITDHWIRSPLINLTNSCGTCHRLSEEELRGRIFTAQDSTFHLLERSEEALLAAQDAIMEAIRAGASDADLQEARALQRRSAIRWDFVSAENSMGFHSPQEANRALGDAIDYARQAELAALRLLAGQTR